MNQKVLCRFSVHYLPELLKCPGRRGMRGNIGVCYPASSDLHDHKNIEQAKIGGNRHEEVASENGPSMVANKGRPTLRPKTISRSPILWHVASDSSRRKPNAKFQEQLGGNTLFTPGRIAPGHLDD